MAVITNQVNATSVTNKVESVANAIYNSDNEDTPLLNRLKSSVINNVVHSWNTEAYAAASFSPVVFGDQLSAATAATSGALETNYVSEVRKELAVSTAAERTMANGTRGRMAQEIKNKTVECKSDLEAGILGNQAPTGGNGTSTAASLRGLPSWYADASGTVDAGATGADGSTSAGRTDGTLRSVTEAILRGVINTLETSQSKPNLIVANHILAPTMLGFNGGATENRNLDGSKGNFIDLYMSPTGNKIEVMFSNHCRSRDCHVLNTNMLGIAYLGKKGVSVEDLAKTATAERKQVFLQATLENRNPAAHGLATDLQA
jgi:Family of unknown function (DUF5309)